MLKSEVILIQNKVSILTDVDQLNKNICIISAFEQKRPLKKNGQTLKKVKLTIISDIFWYKPIQVIKLKLSTDHRLQFWILIV